MQRPFKKLNWLILSENHALKWDELSTRYGFAPYVSEKPDLSVIAEKCVTTCLSFFEKHLEYSGFWAYNTPCLSIEWKHTLCDYLIVSFSHAFLCDNLIPKGQRELQTALAEFFMGTDFGKRIERTQVLDTERKKIERKFNRHYEKIDAIISSINKEEPNFLNLEEVKKELLAAPNWLLSLCLSNQNVDFPFNLFRSEYKEALTGKSSRYKLDMMNTLGKYLGDHMYAPVLFPIQKERYTLAGEEIHPYISPEVPCPPPLPTECMCCAVTGFNVSVCVNWHKLFSTAYSDKELSFKPFPDQIYNIIDSEETFCISDSVQKALNSYSVERIFHGYALAYTMQLLRYNPLSSDPLVLAKQYAVSFSLRCPQLQPLLLHHMNECFERHPYASQRQDICNELYKWVNFWNTSILPTLQNLFVWSVSATFGTRSIDCQKKVLNAINSWFTDDLEEDDLVLRYGKCRADGLQHYRLIPVASSYVAPATEDPIILQMHNTLVEAAWTQDLIAALGQGSSS